MPIVVEDDIIFFHFFSWQHLKAKVCIQDQMTEGLKLIMISIACIDKENCISTSPFLLYSWKMPLCCSIMVSALDSGWRGLGLRPSTGLAWSKHKTLYFHSASIHPGVWMDTGQLSGKSDKMLGSNLVMDQHSIQGGVVLIILLVASCYENPDKLPQDQGHLVQVKNSSFFLCTQVERGIMRWSQVCCIRTQQQTKINN